MYRLLWNYVNRLDVKRRYRQNIFLLICTLFYALIGAVVWFTLGDDLLGKSIKWMICFIGFPSVILGFFCGVLALFKMDE